MGYETYKVFTSAKLSEFKPASLCTQCTELQGAERQRPLGDEVSGLEEVAICTGAQAGYPPRMNLSAGSQPFNAELQIVIAMSFLLDLWLLSLHSKDISYAM